MEYQIDDAIGILSRTPAALRALLTELPDPWLRRNEGGETWAPFDILGHLIDGEETDWIARTRMILEHGDTKAFEPFDRFRHFKRNRGKSVGQLLDEFERLRKKNLEWLRARKLTTQDLARPGRHPALGGVTLGQHLSTWVVHDLNHLSQIARVMAKRYSEDVGPWREYLPILTR